MYGYPCADIYRRLISFVCFPVKRFTIPHPLVLGVCSPLTGSSSFASQIVGQPRITPKTLTCCEPFRRESGRWQRTAHAVSCNNEYRSTACAHACIHTHTQTMPQSVHFDSDIISIIWNIEKVLYTPFDILHMHSIFLLLWCTHPTPRILFYNKYFTPIIIRLILAQRIRLHKFYSN